MDQVNLGSDAIYEVLNVEQGTEAWKQERLKRVTASQIPSLMNLSPYQSALQLLEEKITGKEADVDGFKQVLFQRGHDAELAAREWVESHLNLKFPPSVILSKRCPQLLASLDGFNQGKNVILEAKYMGAKALEDVKAGKIKPHHQCQVQAQLLATGAEKCIYFATTQDGDSAIAEIKPNAEYAANIASAVNEFMGNIHELSVRKQEYEKFKESLVFRYAKPKKDKGDIFPIKSRYK